MGEEMPELEPDDAQMHLDLYRGADPEDALEMQTYDQEDGEWVSRRLVADIIESRMHEILSLIRAEISRANPTCFLFLIDQSESMN